MSYRILATARAFCHEGPHLELLREAGCEVDLRGGERPLSAAELAEAIPGYHGAVLGVDACTAEVIARADELRVISRFGVGFDSVDLAAAAARGIAVTTTPGANEVAVAELTMGLLLALARQLPRVVSATKAGGWSRITGWQLSGKTLGVIGLGAIGKQVARRAMAFDMRVIAFDPYLPEAPAGVELVTLDELLAAADVVTLHAALTRETHNLLDGARLAAMKDGAYLINAARGDLVDEAALYQALTSGKLAGAALDVFVVEPPVGSPLLTLDNVLVTPHTASYTHEALAAMSLLAAHNLLDVLEGRSCPNVVNAELLRAHRSS